MKTTPDKSFFFLTSVNVLAHIIEKNTITLEKIEVTHRCNSKTSATKKQKENPRILWNVKFLQ